MRIGDVTLGVTVLNQYDIPAPAVAQSERTLYVERLDRAGTTVRSRSVSANASTSFTVLVRQTDTSYVLAPEPVSVTIDDPEWTATGEAGKLVVRCDNPGRNGRVTVDYGDWKLELRLVAT